jgi:hypothetical protein
MAQKGGSKNKAQGDAAQNKASTGGDSNKGAAAKSTTDTGGGAARTGISSTAGADATRAAASGGAQRLKTYEVLRTQDGTDEDGNPKLYEPAKEGEEAVTRKLAPGDARHLVACGALREAD